MLSIANTGLTAISCVSVANAGLTGGQETRHRELVFLSGLFRHPRRLCVESLLRAISAEFPQASLFSTVQIVDFICTPVGQV